jgi:hypothetical protein
MIALMIGAAMSGVVLGATSRIIFLLPAALMALMVAAVLIVRADIDLGFTALAATLLNSGFLLGIVMTPVMSRLRIWPRWTVDEAASGFLVRDRFGRPLACVGFDGRPAADSLLTRDEAHEIAADFAKREWVGLPIRPTRPAVGCESKVPESSLLPADAHHQMQTPKALKVRAPAPA